MSTSLVYHAFGVQTYHFRKYEFKDGAIFIHLRKKKQHHRCAQCRSRDVTKEGRFISTLRTVPVGTKPVFLVLHLHELLCHHCGAVCRQSRDVADARKSYTRRFARYVLDLANQMTIKAIADHLGVGWDMIKDIIKADLVRKAKKRSWRKVRYIAIDEIAVRKGHRYMTVVVDLESGQVLYTAEGKDHECLVPFFRRLRRARAKLKAVAVDMSEAYRKAVEQLWPRPVALVHDRYHLVSNMNDLVDKVRRNEQNRQEAEGKKLIKGSRYLLLKGQEKLADEPDNQSRLDKLLEANETLQKVYLLKEELRQFWSQGSKDDAEQFIVGWLSMARALDNKHVDRFAETVEEHMAGILAWYDVPITNGPLEGLNNKIKVFKRAAYGYRDMTFFGLRLMFLHETKFKLSGI